MRPFLMKMPAVMWPWSEAFSMALDGFEDDREEATNKGINDSRSCGLYDQAAVTFPSTVTLEGEKSYPFSYSNWAINNPII